MRRFWKWIRRDRHSKVAAPPGQQEVPRLSLEAYVDAVAGLKRPTDEQIRSFADYVAEAHSWYKHLPLFRPGQPFHFYLDPSRGYKRLVSGGRIALVDLTDDRQRFHYSERKTTEYRARFGHLAFEPWGAGATYVSPRKLRRLPVIPLTEIRFEHLPREVLEAGRVELTAMIHPATAQPESIRRAGRHRRSGDWGDDPHNAAQYEKLYAIAFECYQADGKTWKPHPAIEALLAPERRRQLDAMGAAMHRVCEIVYDSA